jgi:putative PIN family toxin of toxin-antitoxin system
VNRRVVYDTMVFFQWAALPADRQHATIKALYDGSVQLCISKALLDEIREVLSRPEIRAKAPSLTAERLNKVLGEILRLAEWIADVPGNFTWPQHPDDDHLLNLAIAARADWLVTWERRLLGFLAVDSAEARDFRSFAPALEIITPEVLATRLRSESVNE